ncbi:MAG TPA: hypothetical protein VMU12_01355 [Candidatus Paceibacterota bacterium]|nr:hypothetical protein [Candidatus Paceibacterota bacterium]
MKWNRLVIGLLVVTTAVGWFMFYRDQQRLLAINVQRLAAAAAQQEALKYLSGVFVSVQGNNLTYKVRETITDKGTAYVDYVEHTAMLSSSVQVIDARTDPARPASALTDIPEGAAISIVFAEQQQTGGQTGTVVALYVTE